jgi:hypothetical protein
MRLLPPNEDPGPYEGSGGGGRGGRHAEGDRGVEELCRYWKVDRGGKNLE